MIHFSRSAHRKCLLIGVACHLQHSLNLVLLEPQTCIRALGAPADTSHVPRSLQGEHQRQKATCRRCNVGARGGSLAPPATQIRSILFAGDWSASMDADAGSTCEHAPWVVAVI